MLCSINEWRGDVLKGPRWWGKELLLFLRGYIITLWWYRNRKMQIIFFSGNKTVSVVSSNLNLFAILFDYCKIRFDILRCMLLKSKSKILCSYDFSFIWLFCYISNGNYIKTQSVLQSMNKISSKLKQTWIIPSLLQKISINTTISASYVWWFPPLNNGTTYLLVDN